MERWLVRASGEAGCLVRCNGGGSFREQQILGCAQERTLTYGDISWEEITGGHLLRACGM